MQLKSPAEISAAATAAGSRKAGMLRASAVRLLVSSALAGAFIAFGGVLSLIIGRGFPGIAEANPALPRLLSGAVFPVGLILVVVLGVELFTGNNALLIPGYMSRRHTLKDVVLNWTVVYLGNFIGAVLFTWLMVYACGLTAVEPWHSAIISIAEAKVSISWLTVFLRGVGANWCVCLAVWLALSGHNLVEKMAGCWVPVMMFVALGYEHCVANMFFIPLGMMEGADVGVAQALTANFIPATLGNIAGGALLVGTIHTWLHRPHTPL
ncbi:MAG: formate/nitrite transporter family protein [Bacteroidales bacterium]|nr:formate/nitrite transporter family protein [Bacteroidales bacterium]